MARRPPPLEIASLRAATTPAGSVSDIRWKIAPGDEHEPALVERALRERVKELNCLYAIAKLSEEGADSLDHVLGGIVGILPPSWQYPEITDARIVFRDKTFKSGGFKATSWCQSSPIHVYNEPIGEVTVCYREERPASHEGPFLREERALLDAVAERIGALAMRLEAERELQETNRQLTVERTALQETNTALRTVLARIEEEKRETYRDVRANVEKVLMPILHELAALVPRGQRKYVELLRDNLEEITSPFVSRVSSKYGSLTPTEIQVCNLIRSGMRTKDIAEMRGVSLSTVHRHRERIRRKLGIANSGTNLTTHLQMTL